MTELNKEKVQAFRDAIDGEKLAQVIQEMPEERIEKAFQNKDIQKLADKLGEDVELFEAVMGVYDTEKSYAAAVAAVPGNYTKAEFDEFRTVYANLFLKDLHGEVFEGGADSKKLSDEELAARPQQPLKRNRQVSKALRAYAQSVSSADKGGVRIID